MNLYDYINDSPSINNIGFPELKGEVCIKLINKNTGEIEKEIRGKNMVTNALKTIFTSNYFGGIHYPNLQPIFEKLLGGILCYNKPLIESINNMYIPDSTNDLIAHAGPHMYNNTSDDYTRGLPNEEESGPVENGYKWVYDFVPSQGNGTIKSICLTNPDLGDYYLYGGTNFCPVGFLCKYTGGNSYYLVNPQGHFLYQAFDINNKKAYAVINYNGDRNSTKIQVVKLENYTPLNNISYSQKNFSTLTADEQDFYTYDTNYAADGYTPLQVPQENEIHILRPENNRIARFIIDLNDMSKTEKNIELPGYNFSLLNNSWMSYKPWVTLDLNNCLQLVGTNNKIYKLDYFSEEIIGETEIPAGGILYSNSTSGCDSLGNYSIIYAINTSTIILTDGINSYLYDLLGGGYNWNSTSFNHLTPINDLNKLILMGRYGPTGDQAYQNTNFSLIFNKLYLATIKNLEEPIEKTENQMMKIEYTITQI